HTRSYGDWSSDVCSSDLVRVDEPGRDDETPRLVHPLARPRRQLPHLDDPIRPDPHIRLSPADAAAVHDRPSGDEGGEGLLDSPRSEERRVGKEWRARWSR